MWEEFVRIVETADREAARRNVLEARRDVLTAIAIYESARSRSWKRIPNEHDAVAEARTSRGRVVLACALAAAAVAGAAALTFRRRVG